MDTRPPRVRSRISTPFPAVLAAALAPFIAACGPDAPGDRYRYAVPMATGDGWETASLQSVGVDPAPVVAMMEALRGFPDHWIHGIVVAKDGKLVFEEYFSGTDLDLARLAEGLAFREVAFGRDSLHSMASVSKTVTSVLTGIALDRGELPGMDAPLLGWFPGRDPAGDLGGMTLEHVLTMTTGIPWDESPAYEDPAEWLVKEGRLPGGACAALLIGTRTHTLIL